MLEPDQEPAAQGYMAQSSTSEGFGTAVRWTAGWPPYSEYEPIIRVMLANKLRVFAANLPKADVKAIAMGKGTAGLVLPGMTPEQEASLLTEIEDGHCGMLPKEHLPAMANAQRARDVAMASAMQRVEGKHVLIAGRGHTRLDRGVGYVLRTLGQNAVLSIGLFEDEPTLPLAELAAEYDIIGITPVLPTPRPDPCAAFRK
jgi:uncharacterized iron-regulated protein